MGYPNRSFIVQSCRKKITKSFNRVCTYTALCLIGKVMWLGDKNKTPACSDIGTALFSEVFCLAAKLSTGSRRG